VNRRLAVGIVPMALLVFLAAAQFLGRKASAERAIHRRERTFLFTYQVHVPPSPETPGQTRLWIPLPQSDQHQAIRNLSLAPVAYTRGFDSEYGNSFALFVPTPAQVASGYDATLQFEVTRREFAKDVNAAIKPGAASATSEKMLRRYLQPDKLVPLNRAIAELAKEKTDGATDPKEKARRIYTYVATTMRYDKSGEGWGRSDEMWACDSKRGNCTDFHSVLIGMMRSSGMPARFEIGFSLPQGKTEGEISATTAGRSFTSTASAGFRWMPPRLPKTPPSATTSLARSILIE
jgi:transglutaminase-like putative cysteine protease